MSVRSLSFVTYQENGWDWQLEKVVNPTWHDIVAFVRRLDPFRHPWVWLFIGETDDDVLVDCLTIMGGEGGYWIGLSAGKYEQLRLFNPDKGEKDVAVWTSDQGFADKACYITDDLDLVLRIAKHFGETGEPLPDAPWEQQ
jgi:hypothetical protein